MHRLTVYLFPIALLSAPLLAQAQEWDRAPPREVFWDGNCRVEQFVNRDGDVVERRRCRGDRNAYARAVGHADDERAPRGELIAQPGSYAAARNRQVEQHDEPAPAPRIVAQRAPAPVAVKTRELTKAVPVVVAPRVVAKAPLYVTTRTVAKVAPAPAARVIAKAAPAPRLIAKAAPAPRLIAKAAPAPRLIAKAPPAPAPRIVVKAAPAPIAPRVVAKVTSAPKAVRVAVRAAPVAPAPRVAVKVQPVAKPARVIARLEPAAAPARMDAVATAVTKAPRQIVRAAPVVVATRVPAKVDAPVEPRVAAKAEVVGKSPGNYPKSDWLVTLPATEQDTTEAVKAPPVAAKVATGPKPLIAKVEPDWQRHEYREYVVEKSKDRYSNLK